jgi:hypothetical protein
MKKMLRNYIAPCVVFAALVNLSSCSLDPELKDPLSEAPPTGTGAPTPSGPCRSLWTTKSVGWPE